jgi:hypothetical protein
VVGDIIQVSAAMHFIRGQIYIYSGRDRGGGYHSGERCHAVHSGTDLHYSL